MALSHHIMATLMPESPGKGPTLSLGESHRQYMKGKAETGLVAALRIPTVRAV